MRRVSLVIVACLAASLCASPSPVEGGGGESLFLYIHDNGLIPRVHGFQVASTGSLTPVPGSPFNALNSSALRQGPAQTLAYAPRQRLLFATGGLGVTVFQVAADGSLASVGAPVGAALFVGAATVQRGARTFLYLAEFTMDRVRGFQIMPGGALNPLPTSPFAAGLEPVGMSTARGRLFVANSSTSLFGGDSVSAYRVLGDGSLAPAPGSPFSIPGQEPEFETVNAEFGGKYVYLADASLESEFIWGFRVNPLTAALAPLPGSPFDDGLDESDGGLALSKKPILFAFRFVGDETDDIQAMRRGPGGVLAQLGPVQDAGFIRADANALTSNGRFLGTADSRSNLVRLFRVNPATGVLSAEDTEAAVLTDEEVTAALFVER